MEKDLLIGYYKRPDKRATILFRKPNALYRITTIVKAPDFARAMIHYSRDLKKKCAEAEFIVQLTSPRNRIWALEIGLRRNIITVNLMENTSGMMETRFRWKGERMEFMETLATLEVMYIWVR